MDPTHADDEDLQYPALFYAADSQAATDQSRFFLARGAELAALILGAFFGLVNNDVLWGSGPLLAVVMFVVVLALQLSAYGRRAERRWYDARAAAESIKSAAWQYAVGGEAFRRDSDNAEAAFIERLDDIVRGLTHLELGTPTIQDSGVSPDMRQLRESAIQARRDRYQVARVGNQLSWYTAKATFNRNWSRGWWFLLTALEVAALVLGLLRIKGVVDIDLLGPLATAAAGGVAWVQAKNYTQLSESYAVTSHEVSLVAQSLRGETIEAAWAQDVHDAEAAFSREHTMWIARRQG